jgi:toxin ParE1/3/4
VARLSVLPRADRDIDDNFLYIANDRLESAVKFLVAVRSDMSKLRDMPGLGPVWGFKREDLRDVRFWPIGGFRNFLIFYRPTKEGIEVLRVIHGARDVERQFE